jgi:hypothetical protein
MCIFVLCLIVVPLPPGKTPFAIQLNNNDDDDNKILGVDVSTVLYFLLRPSETLVAPQCLDI